MKTETPKTDKAFNAAIRSATYSHGSHLPADAWKDIACDMRDLCRKFESNRARWDLEAVITEARYQ